MNEVVVMAIAYGLIIGLVLLFVFANKTSSSGPSGQFDGRNDEDIRNYRQRFRPPPKGAPKTLEEAERAKARTTPPASPPSS